MTNTTDLPELNEFFMLNEDSGNKPVFLYVNEFGERIMVTKLSPDYVKREQHFQNLARKV